MSLPISRRLLSVRVIVPVTLFALITVPFPALLPAVCAQEQLWLRQFGSGSGDEHNTLASDGAGGVFAAGRTSGSLGVTSAGNYDAYLARYDEKGEQIWIRQFGTSEDDGALALTPDGTGGVMIAGYTEGILGVSSAGGYDTFLARYDDEGNEIWMRQFGTSSDDGALALALDGAGRVMVAGVTGGSLTGPNPGDWDAFLARYDDAGNKIWIRQFGTSEIELAAGLAPDGAEGVMVVGVTYGSLGGPNLGESDTFLARYDSAGEQRWMKQFGTSGEEWTPGLAPDGAGGVVVAGSTMGSLGGPNSGGEDVFLARYDSAGDRIWIRQFGTIEYEWAAALTPDGAGGVFLGGVTDGDLAEPNAGSYDAFLARYDETGTRVWIRQFGVSAGEETTALAPDGAGGVMVAGYTDGGLGGPRGDGEEAFMARYNALGDQRWSKQFGSGGEDRATALAPDGAEGVILGGFTDLSLAGPHAGGQDIFLIRYDGTGNQLWDNQIGTVENDLALALAPNGAGGVMVTGFTEGNLGGVNAGGKDVFLARYNSEGVQRWMKQFGTSDDEGATALASDGAGGVIVAGITGGSLGGPPLGDDDVFLARYDDEGNEIWVRQFGTSRLDEAHALAPVGAGGVVVAGATWGNLGGQNKGENDAFLARYDSAGNQLWVHQFGTFGWDEAYALAPDGAGGVFVAGVTEGDLGGPYAGGYGDAFLARYDGGGNQLWIHQFGTDEDDVANALAPDGAGGVMVAGITDGSLGGPNAGEADAFLAHYDSAGNQIWLHQFTSRGGDMAAALAHDGAGGVMIAGHAHGSLGGPNASGHGDVFLARFEIESCYPDCDQSTGKGVLDIFDFLCFQNGFVGGDPYACDCDTSTGLGVCDIFDFLCFQNAFVGGCP